MREALAPSPGVVEIIEIDTNTEQVKLKIDPDKFDEKKAIAALEKAGYGGATRLN